MRTVFIGTSEFAAAVLHKLAASPHRPQVLVTRPDRPKGRGRHLTAPPAAECARELGIEVYQPASINEWRARGLIEAAQPEIVVVSAYGGLLGEELLSAHQILNVHPSLLPRWRGAAPIERAIMEGDDVTGASIMRMTAALDAGPVCAQRSEPIVPDDTYGTLAGRLAELGGDLLLQALDTSPPCQEQDDALATYAEKISPRDRLLDPSRTATELERQVRALEPHVVARVELPAGGLLGIRRARALCEAGPPPGGVSFDGPSPVLGCAAGSLELLVVQPPGRRAMSGEDYLRGRRGRARS